MVFIPKSRPQTFLLRRRQVVHEGLDADSPLLRRDRAAERESAEPADETSQAAEADAAEAIPVTWQVFTCW